MDGATPVTGRGSWTTLGGTAPSVSNPRVGYYELHTPQVGSQVRGRADIDPGYVDFRAVWAGVKALQHVLNQQLRLNLIEDGTFGAATKAAVMRAQQTYGLLNGFTPGLVGPTLAKRLFRDLTIGAEMHFSIPNHSLAGVLDLESGGWDPGSVGEVSSLDSGLAQFHVDGSRTWWNAPYGQQESVVTHQLAFDPEWAVSQAARRMAWYRQRYSGKSAALQDACSIAQHNAPFWADQWYAAGVAPNPQIAAYVSAARSRAAAY